MKNRFPLKAKAAHNAANHKTRRLADMASSVQSYICTRVVGRVLSLLATHCR